MSNNAACKISVTCGSNPNLLIDNTCRRTRFIYNSSVKVAQIEALMARKRRGYRSQAYVKPVVYSSTYRANVNPAGDTGRNVKPPVTALVNTRQKVTCEVSFGKAACHTQGNVKHTPCESSNGKQPCEALPNVKLISSQNGADNGLKQSVYSSVDASQVLPKSAHGESDPTAKAISSQEVSVDMNTVDLGFEHQPISPAKVISTPGREGRCPVVVMDNSVVSTNENLGKSNASNKNHTMGEVHPIYDINHAGVVDKFVNSILHANQFNLSESTPKVDTEIYNAWRCQSDFKFGFVSIDEQLLPDTEHISNVSHGSPFKIHEIVRSTNKPNFMQARFPVDSQLNVHAWEKHLQGYWDRQLIHLIRFGFPLDYNRSCELIHEQGNHKSATEFPNDVNAYIEEEKKYNALLGPFDRHPIPSGHCSPFMTRAKPNSDRRRIIIDLSWPIGASVNAGIDKTSYLGSTFSLNFPTVDDITRHLKSIGRGAFLYKVDVSRAFRHVKIDPGDYDLLGLEWQGVYVDTCIPFGTRHGSQIFQRLSDAVRYMMRQKGYVMVDYIDDYVGMGVPSVAWASYNALTELMAELGLTISEKKLVPPSTQVTCLGVLIDTVKGTLAIPPEKLQDITQAVRHWLGKDVASKRQLQSILGLLLYVHKCVKPARIFLNRMLDLLRSCHGCQKIKLTSNFKRDLRWFAKFLPTYNGISLYDHKQVDVTLELDACLTGFGGRSGNFVYHLPIQRGFRNWTIVHLEMINILLATRLFKFQWASKKVLIRCDNEAVVTVLKSGKTKDPYLAACARNIWFESALADIDLQYAHIRGWITKWRMSYLDGRVQYNRHNGYSHKLACPYGWMYLINYWS